MLVRNMKKENRQENIFQHFICKFALVTHELGHNIQLGILKIELNSLTIYH